MAPHEMAAQGAAPSDTHNAAPGAKGPISICDFLCFIPLAMIQLSRLLSAGSWCREKHEPQHILLWSCCWNQWRVRSSGVEGSSSSSGHVCNPTVKPAAQTDAEVHQWAKSIPACPEMINKRCTGYQELFYPCNAAASWPLGTLASSEQRRTSITVNDLWWKSCFAACE